MPRKRASLAAQMTGRGAVEYPAPAAQPEDSSIPADVNKAVGSMETLRRRSNNIRNRRTNLGKAKTSEVTTTE